METSAVQKRETAVSILVGRYRGKLTANGVRIKADRRLRVCILPLLEGVLLFQRCGDRVL